MVVSILKISNSQNANCDKMVSFPKSGHSYIIINYYYNFVQEHTVTQKYYIAS